MPGSKEYELYKKSAEQHYKMSYELFKMLSDYRIREEGGDKIDGLRLKVTFNYAVFMFEFLDERTKAIRLLVIEL